MCLMQKHSIELPTIWGEQVSESNVWPEYPRPQFRRQQWQNLNGVWEIQEVKNPKEQPPFGQTLDERVLVPFPIESDLSGKHLHGTSRRIIQFCTVFWYLKTRICHKLQRYMLMSPNKSATPTTTAHIEVQCQLKAPQSLKTGNYNKGDVVMFLLHWPSCLTITLLESNLLLVDNLSDFVAKRSFSIRREPSSLLYLHHISTKSLVDRCKLC